MSLRMSTGLCNQLHDTKPTRQIFDLGFVHIYSGAVPLSADAAAGTLICKVSNNGTATGITWEALASGGTLQKKNGEVWNGTSIPGGVATHFRVVSATDTGGAVPTEPRVQGIIGTGNADMVVGSTTIGVGAVFAINFATLSFVPS